MGINRNDSYLQRLVTAIGASDFAAVSSQFFSGFKD